MMIAILGAGEIGVALATVLHNNHISLRLWDKDLAKVPQPQPLATIVAEASVILLCIPSGAMRSVISTITPHLAPSTIVVSLAKGLEVNPIATMDMVLQTILPPQQPYGILGGPLIAEELTQGLAGRGVYGSRDSNAVLMLRELFHTTPLHVDYTADVRGVALGGVLKNIYAIGLGIIEELKLGSNYRGWFVTAACAEMARLIAALGGQAQTAYTAAGLGDLIATGFSSYSRNHQVGVALAKSGTCDITSEGLMALPRLIQLIGSPSQEYAIVTALHRIVQREQSPQTLLYDLFTRTTS